MEHICFFTLSLRRGGAERVLADLCNRSVNAGKQVSVITCMKEPSEYVLDNRIKHLMLDQDENEDYVNMGERFLKRRKRLKNLLRECKPACIISFLPEPNFICLSLKYQIKCPVIISIRNDPKVEYKNFFRKCLMKYFYPFASGCVFQTEEARGYFSFAEKLYNNSIVIPNSIDEQLIGLEPVREKKSLIVSVGRLDKQKNQKMMIRAFGKIVDDYPQYRLEIYGDGKEKDDLQELIEKLSLSDKVFLRGKVTDLPERIREAEMFILSSDYEGMPNALMEAMAMGIPCISTDCPCGGPRYLIDDKKNGQLIPVGDEERLIEAIKYYIDDKGRAYEMGLNGMSICEKVNPQVVFESWKKYIHTVIGTEV